MASSTSKVIVRLSGGLGNQMFQYAFGRAIARDRELCFDDSCFASDRLRQFRLGCFGVDIQWSAVPRPARLLVDAPGAWRLMRLLGGSLPLPGCRIQWDQMAGYDPAAGSCDGTLVAVGYWQDVRYFASIADEIRESFRPNSDPCSETIGLLEQSPEAIGVQVRRGDYVDARTAEFHPPQPVSYFRDAVRRLAVDQGVRTAIVCSDDPEWAKANLKLPVDRMLFREKPAEDWEDMALLSQCAHIVISNSSFGWWSAWLGAREGREVICPAKWYGAKGASFGHPGLSEWHAL